MSTSNTQETKETTQNAYDVFKSCYDLDLKSLQQAQVQHIDNACRKLFEKIKPFKNSSNGSKFQYDSIAAEAVRIQSDRRKYILIGIGEEKLKLEEKKGCPFLEDLDYINFQKAIEKEAQPLIEEFKKKEREADLEFTELSEKLTKLKKEKEDQSMELFTAVSTMSQEQQSTSSTDSPVRKRSRSFSDASNKKNKLNQTISTLAIEISSVEKRLKEKEDLLDYYLSLIQKNTPDRFACQVMEKVFSKACEENISLKKLLIATGSAYISYFKFEKTEGKSADANQLYDYVKTENLTVNFWGRTLMKIRLILAGIHLTNYSILDTFNKPKEFVDFTKSLEKEEREKNQKELHAGLLIMSRTQIQK